MGADDKALAPRSVYVLVDGLKLSQRAKAELRHAIASELTGAIEETEARCLPAALPEQLRALTIAAAKTGYYEGVRDCAGELQHMGGEAYDLATQRRDEAWEARMDDGVSRALARASTLGATTGVAEAQAETDLPREHPARRTWMGRNPLSGLAFRAQERAREAEEQAIPVAPVLAAKEPA